MEQRQNPETDTLLVVAFPTLGRGNRPEGVREGVASCKGHSCWHESEDWV